MFRKILIANRGEIACRIIRTARRMGIATVAVYSDADADALHVAMADEAYRIGPAAPRESYLNVSAILAAGARSGAEALHPGYGFLSENADFAEDCAAAGIVFIGPPPSAIRAMGGKSQSKALMEQAGVPLVPGYHGAAQDDATLTEAAARIGYPVLIKASAGGGGKGMRVVESPADLPSAIAGAKREGLSSFGDDRLLIERYLQRPRHIEIQVFADTHGQVLHMFERVTARSSAATRKSSRRPRRQAWTPTCARPWAPPPSLPPARWDMSAPAPSSSSSKMTHSTSWK